MIVHSSYGALAYSGIAASSAQQQNGRTTSAAVADQAKIADQISLSSASKALAASESVLTQPRTLAQEHLMMAASSDRESAEKIAYDMAYVPSMIAWDLSDIRGGETPRKLSTNGKIVDDAYISNFDNTAPLIDAQRRAIYETEKAKGTDPLQILSMMIDFTNSQSQAYLEATGWGAQG